MGAQPPQGGAPLGEGASEIPAVLLLPLPPFFWSPSRPGQALVERAGELPGTEQLKHSLGNLSGGQKGGTQGALQVSAGRKKGPGFLWPFLALQRQTPPLEEAAARRPQQKASPSPKGLLGNCPPPPQRLKRGCKGELPSQVGERKNKLSSKSEVLFFVLSIHFFKTTTPQHVKHYARK